eukprot:659771-Rhodomonas_salina.4
MKGQQPPGIVLDSASWRPESCQTARGKLLRTLIRISSVLLHFLDQRILPQRTPRHPLAAACAWNRDQRRERGKHTHSCAFRDRSH